MLRFIGNIGAKAMSMTINPLLRVPNFTPSILSTSPGLLMPKPVLSEQVRTVIKFSRQRGKRKTVHAVPERFFRLHWGAWIRTLAGRHKKIWKRSLRNQRRMREHVFCNATQSTLLDKMVSAYWRRPKYYIDDPYTPYHTREDFWITRKQPWRPEGWEH